jgi:hypothetical protein
VVRTKTGFKSRTDLSAEFAFLKTGDVATQTRRKPGWYSEATTMKRNQRKTAPKVVDGRVQKKNRNRRAPCYVGDRRVAIERRKPGYDYRHAVTQNEVYAFLQIVPGWQEYAKGLNKIILDEGNEYRSGWFQRGTIAVCAFPRDLRVQFGKPYFYRDVDFFERMAVPYSAEATEQEGDGKNQRPKVTCQFNKATARYYALMRTLLHELGHHLDLETNDKQWCSRGEEFAESVGRALERRIWPHYCRVFGNPIPRAARSTGGRLVCTQVIGVRPPGGPLES